MGSISGKCKQGTSCHSAPSTPSSTDRTSLVLLVLHSRYPFCAFSGKAKVNRMNFFPSESEKRLFHSEMCHKSLPSAGAKLHATDEYYQGPLSSAPHFPEF